MMNKIINSYYLNPLPNLPPRGKELKVKPFPPAYRQAGLGETGKGVIRIKRK